MRILALVSDRSVPPVTGPKVRNRHLWRALERQGAEVRILGTDLSRSDAAPAEPGEFFPPEREVLPLRAWNALNHSYHEWPVSRRLASRVRELAAEWRPDVVHAEELRMSAYLPPRPAGGGCPILSVTLHNVETDVMRLAGSTSFRIGRRLIERHHLRSLIRFERERLAAVDVAFAYSPADLARHRRIHPDVRWALTRNGADAAGVRPAPQPAAPSVLLVGSLSYAPNVRGLAWFLDEILPLLGTGITVTVAGSGAGTSVRARLAATAVRFADEPTDLAPLYAEHAVCAVPVLEGSGTRGKILEALAHGRAVVSTRLGAGGLDLADGEGISLADDPADFAATVRHLAQHPAEREALARRGREAVLARYDWSVAAGELLEEWNRCASR